ncbi:MAG: preprotein translocase subunit YajC [Azoarcus sp.]|nr:preprotein translocase subunit YajC [Azoarcus sp.]
MLISNAYAQAANAAPPAMGESPLGYMFPILMIVVLYFLLIRPQMKRAKEHKTMVDAVSKGDEVITGGGIAGKVTELGDNYIQVEIAANTVVTVQKQTITAVLPKGTLKTL